LLDTIGHPAFVFLSLGLGLGVYGSFVVSYSKSARALTLLLTRLARYYYHNLRLHRYLVLDYQASVHAGRDRQRRCCSCIQEDVIDRELRHCLVARHLQRFHGVKNLRRLSFVVAKIL
jgi:hypothetical protein